MTADLDELEAHLRSTLGCWNHYRLRIWQQCRSFDSASIEDRIRIAEKVLDCTYRGDVIWGMGALILHLNELQAKLEDVDPHIRQDAIFALVEFGHLARSAVPVLLDRLRSSENTTHDRTLAAWALPRIGASGEEAVPILLAVLDEPADEVDAGELRRYSAEAIEQFSDSFRVLVPLSRRCLRDRFWKCRLHGLLLVERLVQRERRLWRMLLPNVEPLVNDEVDEVREVARRIIDGFSKGVSQNSFLINYLE